MNFFLKGDVIFDKHLTYFNYAVLGINSGLTITISCLQPILYIWPSFCKTQNFLLTHINRYVPNSFSFICILQILMPFFPLCFLLMFVSFFLIYKSHYFTKRDIYNKSNWWRRRKKKKKKKTQEIICIFVLVNGFFSVSGIVGLNSMWESLLIGRLSMSPICSIKFPTELFVTWQSKAYTTANSGFF